MAAWMQAWADPLPPPEAVDPEGPREVGPELVSVLVAMALAAAGG